MTTFFLTFGVQYGASEIHPQGGHKDGWFEIEAPTYEEARIKAFDFFDTKWANLYEEDDFEPKFFPLGCLGRI